MKPTPQTNGDSDDEMTAANALLVWVERVLHKDLEKYPSRVKRRLAEQIRAHLNRSSS